jgi:hypothetical protein
VKLDSATDRLVVAHESVILKSSTVSNDLQLPAINRWASDVILRDELSLVEYRQVQHYGNSSLASISSDSRFPGTAWLREQLKFGIKMVELDEKDLAAPSPPGTRSATKITGAGLARQVAQLRDAMASRFQDWLGHIRTALPDVRMVSTALRERDS